MTPREEKLAHDVMNLYAKFQKSELAASTNYSIRYVLNYGTDSGGSWKRIVFPTLNY